MPQRNDREIERDLGESDFTMKKVVRREEVSRSTTPSSFPARSVWYGECQKNHAAAMGGYAVDGCREFMASTAEGTPGSLVCAACSCHRNFHRRQFQAEVASECRSPSHSSTDYN